MSFTSANTVDLLYTHLRLKTQWLVCNTQFNTCTSLVGVGRLVNLLVVYLRVTVYGLDEVNHLFLVFFMCSVSIGLNCYAPLLKLLTFARLPPFHTCDVAVQL